MVSTKRRKKRIGADDFVKNDAETLAKIYKVIEGTHSKIELAKAYHWAQFWQEKTLVGLAEAKIKEKGFTKESIERLFPTSWKKLI